MEHKLNLMKVRISHWRGKMHPAERRGQNTSQTSTLLRVTGSQTESQQQEQWSAVLERRDGEIKRLFR